MLLFVALPLAALEAEVIQEYPVPGGSHPHDVAPAPDGRVWYTAQNTGELGWLDPATGRTGGIPLGRGSRPHGVIVGPDGAPWITDSGLNAVVRVDPATEEVRTYPLPASTRGANLNTASFDSSGVLWFTGQGGYHGSLDPRTGRIEAYASPRGRGPYGIHTAPDGRVYYVSLAGNYLGRIEGAGGSVTVLPPPAPNHGTRRVWFDSRGSAWITGWSSGKLLRYEPAGGWSVLDLPGARPQPYAVYVDERDLVWVSDFGSNSIHRYDPATATFASYVLPSRGAAIRQLLGRPGEVWGAESGTDKLVVVRY